jgi:hypothetical protein
MARPTTVGSSMAQQLRKSNQAAFEGKKQPPVLLSLLVSMFCFALAVFSASSFSLYHQHKALEPGRA